MWMSREDLKALYPEITWKRGQQGGDLHYWGLYNGMPVLLAHQTTGVRWYEDENGERQEEEAAVIWEISAEGVGPVVCGPSLENALREFRPFWEKHLQAQERRANMFLVVPAAEA